MGGLTSKHVEEVVQASTPQTTPKNTHVLSFDPRSPSDDITRTPIAVMDTPDGDRKGNCTPQEGKALRVLDLDPRSPIGEVNRTPIVVEANETKTHRRPYSLKPSRLAQLDSLSSSNDESNDNDEQDPRSPTTKVPRTPLGEKVHVFSDSEPVQKCDSNKNEDQEIKNGEETKESSEVQDKSTVMNPFVNEESATKVRRPLTSLQNTTTNNTPRGLLQAKQCRNVEEEYNKNHQIILGQLSTQEKTVASNTQFVESI